MASDRELDRFLELLAEAVQEWVHANGEFCSASDVAEENRKPTELQALGGKLVSELRARTDVHGQRHF